MKESVKNRVVGFAVIGLVAFVVVSKLQRIRTQTRQATERRAVDAEPDTHLGGSLPATP